MLESRTTAERCHPDMSFLPIYQTYLECMLHFGLNPDLHNVSESLGSYIDDCEAKGAWSVYTIAGEYVTTLPDGHSTFVTTAVAWLFPTPAADAATSLESTTFPSPSPSSLVIPTVTQEVSIPDPTLSKRIFHQT